jgi:rubrerythrin
MSKDEVLQKLYEIVRWDYAERADEKYPCPFSADVRKHVNRLLRYAEAYLNQPTLEECPVCEICGTVTVRMNGDFYACPLCGNRQQ